MQENKGVGRAVVDRLLNNPLAVVSAPNEFGKRVIKYRRQVFYKALWDEDLLEARGMVINPDNTVFAHPFSKIFNEGEAWATTLKERDVGTAVYKVNGYLLVVKWLPEYNMPHFSTSGSCQQDTDHIRMAKELWKPEWNEVIKTHQNVTFMFEVCHPNDPHIVPEKAGLYHIGSREDGELWDEFRLAFFWRKYQMGEMVGRISNVTLAMARSIAIHSRNEGIIFVAENNKQRLKLKSPYYLHKKFMARANANVLRNILEQGEIAFKEMFDEEFYPMYTYLQNENLREEFFLGDDQYRLKIIREQLLKGA